MITEQVTRADQCTQAMPHGADRHAGLPSPGVSALAALGAALGVVLRIVAAAASAAQPRPSDAADAARRIAEPLAARPRLEPAAARAPGEANLLADGARPGHRLRAVGRGQQPDHHRSSGCSSSSSPWPTGSGSCAMTRDGPTLGEHEPGTRPDRRRFLARLSLALSAAWSAAAARLSRWSASCSRRCSRRPPRPGARWARWSTFTVGQTVEVTLRGCLAAALGRADRADRRLAAPREASDDFTAFSINCTHLGCPVQLGAERPPCSSAPATAASTTRMARSPPARRPTRCRAIRCGCATARWRSAPAPFRSPGASDDARWNGTLHQRATL